MSTYADIVLFEEDSAIDLALRGFDRDAIREMTGEDIGYHGNALRSQTAGIDRMGYKVEHVKCRVNADVVSDVLSGWSEATFDVNEALSKLGLANPNVCKLKDLFAELGLADEFHTADKAHRRVSMRRGMVERYGVDNPFKLDSFQEQAADTREQRYGARYTLASGSALEGQARQSMREQLADETRHGQIIGKRKATLKDNLGVELPAQSSIVQEKMRQTCLERYGVEHWAKTEQARLARRDYMLAHREDIVEKSRQTCVERYGVENWSQTDVARAQRSERISNDYNHRAKVRRDRIIAQYGDMSDMVAALFPHFGERIQGVSSSELTLLGMLVGAFGVDDVAWQYIDVERYPFFCDFYIKSRDLFIELNGSWTHGGHWWGSDSLDEMLYAKWESKHSDYYDNALETWSERDWYKRGFAKDHELNYVVFWDGKDLLDAHLWFGMGCPDGQDWKREYSWLPERTLSLENGKAPVLRNTSVSVIKAAKWANGRVFFEREMALWDENPYQHTWGTLQAQIYANRYKFMNSENGEYFRGKLPGELTDGDIVRAFGVSGKLRAYTAFDTTAMRQVIESYGVTSVLDPCAGWGERIATCMEMGVAYTGFDINEKLASGYAQLIDEYGDTALHRCTLGVDSAEVDIVGDYDAVITCPPYKNTEMYTEVGAENLDDNAFRVWWDAIVKKFGEHARLFCVQTNQACKALFAEVLGNHGWYLLESFGLPKRVSHMVRKRSKMGDKREFEEMLVFAKHKES